MAHDAATSLGVLDDSLTFGSPPSPFQMDAITPPTNTTKSFTTARQAYHTQRPFGRFFRRQCGTEMPFPPRGLLTQSHLVSVAEARLSHRAQEKTDRHPKGLAQYPTVILLLPYL
ncbi:hypothetical protein B0T13DRAFT_526927 [Neurospora crassa]|nr:hypothetical protein B0T13DRAFT_526927 [Neurospora crassa]